jgi:hypothetical protein
MLARPSAVEKIHKDIDFLVLHQTTQHVDTGERILEELSKLNIASPPTSAPKSVKSFGTCLGRAPLIAPNAFKGRTDELRKLRDWLIPATHAHHQSIASAVGMGGIGKTQLSLAFARDCVDQFTSIFWVNGDATHELSCVPRLV